MRRGSQFTDAIPAPVDQLPDHGQIIAQGPEDVDALVVADIDLEVARAARETWRFDAHRRPETYGALTA